MSSGVQKSSLIFSSVVLGCFLSTAAVYKDSKAFTPKSFEFFRTKDKILVRAPNGNSVVTLLPPANENSESTILAQSGNQKLSLGHLRRQANVFWRADSGAAVLWDQAYSNHYFVRLIRTAPTLHEVKGFDQLIKNRVLKQFKTDELMHYWPIVKGWTAQGELIVVVCADGVPEKRGSLNNTPLMGFERGYLVDTRRSEIRSEFGSGEFNKIVGSNPCQ
jgi:hypothetical protein